MRKNRFRGNKPKHTGPRRNHLIRVPEVRVLGSDGDQLGIMSTKDALMKAEEEGLDLVCLLYTSPSPRDKTVSRMPSSA